MKAYTFHTDAGHGWLQVKKSELRTLGIAEKITGFSYQYLDSVYLEEDCDAGTFLSALKAQGTQFAIKERHDGDYSRIRDFANYVA